MALEPMSTSSPLPAHDQHQRHPQPHQHHSTPIHAAHQPAPQTAPATTYSHNQQQYIYHANQPNQTMQQPHQTMQQPHQTMQQPHQTMQQPHQSIQQPYQTMQQPHQSMQQPLQSIQQHQNEHQRQNVQQYQNVQQPQNMQKYQSIQQRPSQRQVQNVSNPWQNAYYQRQQSYRPQPFCHQRQQQQQQQQSNPHQRQPLQSLNQRSRMADNLDGSVTVPRNVDPSVMSQYKELEYEKCVLTRGLSSIDAVRHHLQQQTYHVQQLQDYLTNNHNVTIIRDSDQKVSDEINRVLDLSNYLHTTFPNHHHQQQQQQTSSSTDLQENLPLSSTSSTPSRSSGGDAARAPAPVGLQLGKLHKQNCALAQEVSEQSEHINQLESEKAALIRELFRIQGHANKQHGSDTTFM